jgi:hypothetical protein
MPVQHCASAIAIASASSSLAGIPGFSRRPLSLGIPEASSPICVPVSPFLHANVLGAHSAALPPQLPWRDHPPPACACAAHIASLMCSTTRQELDKRLSTAAHLSPIPLMIPTHLLFQLLLSPFRRLCSSLCTFLGRPLMLTNLRDSTSALSNDRTRVILPVTMRARPETHIVRYIHR